MVYFMDNYSIERWGKRRDAIRAIITCRNEDDTVRGCLRFWSEETRLSKAHVVDFSGVKVIYINYPISELETIVDMLRNEKPIGLYYGSDDFASVYCGREPIGEEEHRDA